MSASIPEYAAKNAEYFGNLRSDALSLLPATADCVLEVGCGTGRTLEFLRSSGRCRRTYGVELVPQIAAEASKRVDQIFVGNIEELALPLEPASVNAILCLDVLEHMIDPWTTTRKLGALLCPGGVLLASIPNVQNYRVVLPLLRGRWDYASEGLLDRTHLRFFTRSSAIELMQCSGLVVDRVEVTGVFGRTLRVLSTVPALRPFLGFQFLIRARKS